MATIESAKPGEITGSSVLAGRTPSYRLVLKVDPQTGQYTYEYEVDDSPRAVDTIVTQIPDSASAAIDESEETTTETQEETEDTPTTFEQTQAALTGPQRGPEDRGSYRDRFGTAEDQGFGFSGGTGTFRDPRFGREGDTFTPGPGIGKAYDEFGRLRDIGAIKDIGLNIADTVGRVAGPVKDFVAGGGILGAIDRTFRDKKEDTKTPTTGPSFDDEATGKKSFEQVTQALGGTADLGSTRGLFSDMTAAREDIDNQIADLAERSKSPFAPRTFIENKIQELQKQKESLQPTGQVDPRVRDTRRPDALDTPATTTGARTVDRPSMRDIAGDTLSRVNTNYGAAKTGTEKRGVENNTEVKAIRDRVGQQTADPGRTVDKSNAVSNKARANEVRDKHGNAVTNQGKAINFGARPEKKQMTRADVQRNREQKQKEKDRGIGGQTPGPQGQKGGKGSGKQGRIICSELYRQGLISKEDYVLDLYYTSKYLTEQHTAGYWHFAVPAVKAMRRSKFWTSFWKEIAYNRLQDIKWRLGEGKFNLRGRMYSAVFEPFCYISGYFTPNATYNELYEGEQ